MAAYPKTPKDSTANLGFEATLSLAADKGRLCDLACGSGMFALPVGFCGTAPRRDYLVRSKLHNSGRTLSRSTNPVTSIYS